MGKRDKNKVEAPVVAVDEQQKFERVKLPLQTSGRNVTPKEKVRDMGKLQGTDISVDAALDSFKGCEFTFPQFAAHFNINNNQALHSRLKRSPRVLEVTIEVDGVTYQKSLKTGQKGVPVPLWTVKAD